MGDSITGDTRSALVRASMYGLAMTLVTAFGLGSPGYAAVDPLPLPVAVGLGAVTTVAVFAARRLDWDALSGPRR